MSSTTSSSSNPLADEFKSVCGTRDGQAPISLFDKPAVEVVVRSVEDDEFYIPRRFLMDASPVLEDMCPSTCRKRVVRSRRCSASAAIKKEVPTSFSRSGSTPSPQNSSKRCKRSHPHSNTARAMKLGRMESALKEAAECGAICECEVECGMRAWKELLRFLDELADEVDRRISEVAF